jgi:hypothetical protein
MLAAGWEDCMLAGNFPHRGAALALIALILTTAAHA